MQASQEHILREQCPLAVDPSVVPTSHHDAFFELSEEKIKFLLHAIKDMNPEVVDAKEEIRKRVFDVQQKAFQIYPYPCIHNFYFISFPMAEDNAFTHILKVSQSCGQANTPLLLDIGCCMGMDLRHLVQSGYPATSVIGCDIRRDFIDLGYELCGDRNSCPIPFLVGDIFDITLLPFPQVAAGARPSLKDVRNLNELYGQVKYIYAGLLFHLFDEGTQEAIARRFVALLDVRKGCDPAVLFGRHVAQTEEGTIDDALGRTRYAHSPASWKRLWERVLGDKIRVHVNATFCPCLENSSAWNPGRGTRMMLWSVWVG